MVEKNNTLEQIENTSIEKYIPSEEIQISLEKKLVKVLELKMDQSIELKQLANKYGRNVFINLQMANINLGIEDIRQLVLPLIIRDIFDKMKKDLFRNISITSLEELNNVLDGADNNIPFIAKISYLLKKRGIIDSNGNKIRDMYLSEIGKVLGISKRIVHYQMSNFFPEECPRISKRIENETKQIEGRLE